MKTWQKKINVRHGKFAQKNKHRIWKYGYPMEKIIKWNKRRDFNEDVGPKLINVGPSFIPDYRIGIDYSSIVDPRPLRNCDVIYGCSPVLHFLYWWSCVVKHIDHNKIPLWQRVVPKTAKMKFRTENGLNYILNLWPTFVKNGTV